jgi:FixJ family two-component response regulator
MARESAAIVDDEDEILDLIEQILKEEGLRTRRFHTAEEVLDVIDAEPYDIIISDLMLPADILDSWTPSQDGVRYSVRHHPGYASLDQAIEAVHGSLSFIKKPFNIEEIRIVVNRLRQRQDLIEEIKELKRQVEQLQAAITRNSAEDYSFAGLPPIMPPLQGASDMSKAFSAIEYLGRLKSMGHTEKEIVEYKGGYSRDRLMDNRVSSSTMIRYYGRP